MYEDVRTGVLAKGIDFDEDLMCMYIFNVYV
jgi:hypothetical protein